MAVVRLWFERGKNWRDGGVVLSRYPVFIVGSPRSGTSALVDVMLSAGYNGYREGNFLPLISIINMAIDRHFSVFGKPGEPVLAANVDRSRLKSDIAQVFQRTVDACNPVAPWFDKSGNPEMIEAIPVIRSLWPNSLFIFAKRRAIENIFSRIKKFPTHAFEYHCADWARNMLAWRKTRGQLPLDSYLEVDQQDMIQGPAQCATAIAGFLKLSQEAASALSLTMQHNRPQETEAGSARRVYSLETLAWSPQQREVFLKHCAGEMAAFGYTTDDAYRVCGAS